MLYFVVCTILVISIANGCQYNYHCDDNDPISDDVFLKSTRFCFNIPTTANRRIVPTNLSLIIDETDAVPFSFSSKVALPRVAKIVVKEINPHRFIHCNTHKVDPVAELRKLEKGITNSTSNYEFHERMTAISQRMNDFQRHYSRPEPLNITVAMVGFNMKEFF